MEVEKNLNAMPKASHIIEDSARFRLVMPKNPIFKSTTKKYPEGDALVKVYMVMPNLLQDTTDTEPFYNFMYSDLPEMLVQKRGSSHFDSIIKNIGAQDNPLGLKFKDKKNIQREKYKGVEASFDSNEDGFYMKAYIYQVKNRFYIFTFMQIERYCTNEEIEGYLSKFEILE